jgi:hypothetical protein
MNKIIAFVFITTLSGCGIQALRPLTDKEKTEIIEAVTETAHAITDAANQINFLNFKDFFMESPDYTVVTPDGSILNYNQYLKSEKDFFESVSTLHATIINESTKVLESTLAVYTCQLKVNAILKTGKELTFDNIVYSEIYKKIDNQWKIIFIQEAGQHQAATSSEIIVP